MDHNMYSWRLKKIRAHQDVIFEAMQDRRHTSGYWNRRIWRAWLVRDISHSDWWTVKEDEVESEEMDDEILSASHGVHQYVSGLSCEISSRKLIIRA